MTEPDIRAQITDLAVQFAKLETDVRITKHDVANMAQAQMGWDRRLEKMEERLDDKIDVLGAEIKGLAHEISGKIEKLYNRLDSVGTAQARGLGFFGGMAFVLTASGAILVAFWKLLSAGVGGHP